MKQTEIDGVADTLIPDDWEVKRLGELFEMRAGGDVNKQHFSYYKSDKYKYKIFSNGLENEGVYGFTDLPRYKGDSITITGRGTVGVSMYRKDDFDAVIRLLVLESRNKNQTNNFFISELINEVVKFPNESTGVPQLTVPQIKDVLIPLPPLPEQQRIAKALSDVDALISTTEKLIQKKKNIKQGAMQNLLTGKKRLPGFGDKQTDLFVPNGTHTKEVKDVSPEQIRLSAKMKQTELGEIPEDWEVKNIGTTCNVITGGEAPVVYSKDKNTLYKYPIYSNGKEVYGYHASYTIDHDAVCISSIGENTGDIFYYQKNFTPIIRLKVIIPKKSNIDTEFLYYCLKTIKIDTTKNGGIPNINSNDVKSINYIQPTSKEEQTAIANVLSSMDKEIETLNTKIEKYRNLKTAMMQQLLTGKIRLGQGEINDR